MGPGRDAVPAQARRRSTSDRARAGRAGGVGGRRLERVPGGRAARGEREFLAELVSLRRSIVVAGAHGKTTTTGMIAFVLAELGLDPAWLVGGEIAQLGGNAGAGEGWLVVEGDESDRTVERLRPEIGVVTNVELDHHSTFGSAAEVEAMFERWLAAVPQVVRGWELEPVVVRAGGARASTTGGMPRRRSPRSSSPASRGRRRAGARALPRRRTPLRARRRGGRRHGRRRLRPSSVRDRGHGRRRARALRRAGCSSSSSRTSTPARVTSPTSSAPRCRRADAACVTEIYRAREQPVRGRRAASSSSTRSARACARAGRRRSRTAQLVAALGAARRPRPDRRRRRRRARRAAGARGARVNVRGRDAARAADDDRHGRAGARVRAGRRALGELEHALAWAARARPPGRDRRPRLEPARRRRGRRRARAPARGRARVGARRRRAARRRRRSDERRLPPPGARGGPRRLRVRLRDPRHGRRRRLDERGRVRQRLVGDPRPRARRHGRGRRLADAGRARPLLPALRAPARPGRRRGRVPARAAAARRDQGRRSPS